MMVDQQFNDTNYWEQQGTNPFVKKPAAPVGPVSLEQLLAAAVAQKQQQAAVNPNRDPRDPDGDGFTTNGRGEKIPLDDPNLQDQRSGMGLKMPSWVDTNANTPLTQQGIYMHNDPGFGASFKAPVPEDTNYNGPSTGSAAMGALGGFGGKLKDAASSIAQSIIAQFNESKQRDSMTPESIWDRLSQSTPQYSYDGPDGQSMAAQEFAPQYEILKQLGAKQQGNYDSGTQKLKGMFDSLVNDTRQSTDKINANYAAATNQINANGAQAAGNVTNNVAASGADINEQMARLGQQEALPALDDKRQAALTQNLGNLASGQQNSANMMTGLGANAYAYGQERGDIQQQSGILRQADFLQEFMDAQSQNEMTRLGLSGQQGAQANKYNLSIADMNRQGQSDWLGAVGDRTKGVTDFNQQQTENEMRQAGLSLDMAKMQQAGAPKPEDTNAYDKLQQAALSTYGDPASAATMTQEIMNAWKNAPPGATPVDLMRSMDEATLQQHPEIQALAFAFFNSVGSKG